jgi:hypothetical protein
VLRTGGLDGDVEGGRLQKLRDPEIEESYLAFARDQHIAGFQVAVHDEVPVRPRDRFARFLQQSDAFPHGKVFFVTVAVDGTAFDELHHEIRTAILRGAAIEEPRDQGMLEVGQDPPFDIEPPAPVGAENALLHDLQRRKGGSAARRQPTRP